MDGKPGVIKRLETIEERLGIDYAAIAADEEARIARGVEQNAPTAEHDATEAAAELAAEHNVNLAGVTGTGEDGKITKPDVQDYIDAH